jgi:hypothetical protein
MIVVVGVFMRMIRMLVNMLMRLLMVMTIRIRTMMFGGAGVVMNGFAVLMIVMLMIVRRSLRRFGVFRVDDLALHPLAIAAAARIAMPRTAVAAGAVFGFFLGLAMRAFVGFDQGLTIGDRDLIVIGMDFAEGQEAVAIAAIFDEGGLQRRFYASYLGEIDIAAQLLALGGFEIKFFDAIAAHHDNPGLFRVGGIDQHFVGHFGALDGGGRAWRQAHVAQPGDATVHLIRG